MAVYATTDLHGNYDLWEQIKNFLKEDDTLIFLGDAVDRGSRGFEIFKEMLEHDQVVYLLGNHEQYMYEAYHDNIGPDRGKVRQAWKSEANGGWTTEENIKSLDTNDIDIMELINKIPDLPYFAEYTNEFGMHFILCHAGYTPSDYFDNLPSWKKEDKVLWDRNHFQLSWPKEEKYWNVIVIHGHTPILLQKQTFPEYRDATGMAPYWYEDNHKVNLDAATPNTGLAFLLNLDTLDYELFVADPDYPVYKKKK